jgi:hypothetical protein
MSMSNVLGIQCIARQPTDKTKPPAQGQAVAHVSSEAADMPDPETGIGDPGLPIEIEIKKRPDDVVFNEKKQNLYKCARSKVSDNQAAAVKSLSMSQSLGSLCHERDERGNTALHYAAKAGNLDICKLLHSKGADVTARGQNKMTPLQFAARYGDEARQGDVWRCMKWIMDMFEERRPKKHGLASIKKEKEVHYDVMEKDKYDFSILHHAIQNTNWEEDPIVVKELIKTEKFKMADSDRQGNTSVHLAALLDKQENHNILDIFLNNPNIPDEDLADCIQKRNLLNKTPLHIACGVGNHESVEQLVDAAKRLHIDVASILNLADDDGYPPLHLAIESDKIKILEILMKEGVKVSEEAIHCAARLVTR